jgi:hypothetical protein
MATNLYTFTFANRSRAMAWLIIFLLYLTICPDTEAQTRYSKQIVGRWEIHKLFYDTTVVLDIDHWDRHIQQNLAQLRLLKPDYTPEDSLQEIIHLENTKNHLKNVFLEFRKDGTYSRTDFKQRKISLDIITGRYKIIRKTNTLIMTDDNGKQTGADLTIKEDVLILVFEIDRKNQGIVMHYKKVF